MNLDQLPLVPNLAVKLVPQQPIQLDYSKIHSVSVADVHPWDSPDFSDAYIEEAWIEGRPMSDDELEVLNQDASFINQHAGLQAAGA